MLLLAAVWAVGGGVARRPVGIADLPPVKPTLRVSQRPLTFGGKLDASLVRSILRFPQRCQGGRRKGNDQGYGKKKFVHDEASFSVGVMRAMSPDHQRRLDWEALYSRPRISAAITFLCSAA
jgi:hypothetical protein